MSHHSFNRSMADEFRHRLTTPDKNAAVLSGLLPVEPTIQPDPTDKRTPDMRSLLYWNPAITFAPGQEQVLEFYTFDEAGEFEIVIQGVTRGGQLIDLRQSFTIGQSNP